MKPYIFPHSNFSQSGFFSKQASIIPAVYTIQQLTNNTTYSNFVTDIHAVEPFRLGKHSSKEEMHKRIRLVHFVLKYRYRETCPVEISIRTSNILNMVFPSFTQSPKKNSGKGLGLTL